MNVNRRPVGTDTLSSTLYVFGTGLPQPSSSGCVDGMPFKLHLMHSWSTSFSFISSRNNPICTLQDHTVMGAKAQLKNSI